MAEEHDKTHRLVFAFPRMVEDLIRFCLGGEWVERLDFSTLEKVPERLLSPELVRREQDVLWRLKYVDPEEDEDDVQDEDRGPFVYIHLEHLSRPKRLAALDTTAYKLLVLQDLSRRKGLTRSKKKGKKEIPWIISAVLYTGEKEWKPTTSLLEFIKATPGAPEDLWSFRLIDLQRFPLEEQVGPGSPLRGLFKLERLEEIGELPGLAREIQASLPPEDQDLAAAFVELVNEVVLARLTPEGTPQMRITDLVEVPSMLAQRIDNITRGWELQGWEKGKAEGWKKGKAEGRKKGEAEGRKKGEAAGERKEAAHLFLELYAAKHDVVPKQVRERVASAPKDQLETWAKRLLTVESPEDVFKD